MNTLKISAVSTLSNPFEMDNNLSKMSFFCKEAAKSGSNLVVFPEMNITGYTTGEDLEKTAVELNSGLIAQLEKISEDAGISYLCGLAEKEDENIFAAHLFIHNGKLAGKYRKVQPGPPELEILTPGNEIPVFEISGWKFGIQLCFDSHFPEISTIMAKKGADFIIIPHASPRGSSKDKLESWKRHLTARAFDNSIYVLANNQCGLNSKNIFFPGVNLLISPLGKLISQDLCEEEKISVFSLEKKELDLVQGHRMSHFLRYRRNDFYKENL